jgi:poly [ADP-ribose] polymerase
MTQVIEHRKFVCVDASNNANKFWEYIYDSDAGTVIVKYGRVGKTHTEDPPKAMSRKDLDKRIKEKLKGSGTEGTPSYKPPYREIQIVAETHAIPKAEAASKATVREAAAAQLAKNNPELTALIERLVNANKHELYKATGGQMDIDVTTGIISTPVGVVTKDNVAEARTVLSNLADFVIKKDFDNKSYIQSLNTYLMLVPQVVGHARGWHTYFLPDDRALQKQNSLLDQLDASADLAAARLAAAASGQAATTVASTPSLFDADLELCTDKIELDRINKFFEATINSRHESRHLRPKRVYHVKIGKADKAYANDGGKMSNVQQLWHGTRMFNVLSILKNSLMLPKTIANAHITGAMFGDGIYGSDQSTKSLNYAYGYWDGGAREKNCFMFLVDFAMGKSYTPSRPGGYLPAGHDSIFAAAGKSGVMNNEMIVFRESQVNPRFLIEFEEKR